MDIWLERHNVAAAQGKRTMWPKKNLIEQVVLGAIFILCKGKGVGGWYS